MEGGILAGMAVIMTLIGVYIPLLEGFINIINALPIIIFVVRNGVKKGIVVSFVAAFLMAILANPLNALLFLIALSPVALILGWSFRERKAVQGIVLGGVTGFFGQLAIVALAVRFFDFDFFASYQAMINEVGNAMIEAYKRVATDEAAINEFAKIVSSGEAYSIIVVPTFILFSTFLLSYINFWLARMVLRKTGQSVEDFPPFRHWDLPKTFLYGWGLGLASWQAGAYFFGTDALTYKFGMNCFLFFTWALFIQGFAVASFFLAKYNVPKVLRLLFAVVVLSISLLSLIVIYAGVLDIFINYRRLPRKG